LPLDAIPLSLIRFCLHVSIGIVIEASRPPGTKGEVRFEGNKTPINTQLRHDLIGQKRRCQYEMVDRTLRHGLKYNINQLLVEHEIGQ
jgi:hypothetical protein